MIAQMLEDSQPIVYHALDHAVRQNRISSAWLFSGPCNTPKYEAAILLAQSIFCEKQDGLACEECNTCRRVKEGQYADMVILDGRESTISKDMVDHLQEQFSHTALEKNGQRVYIIRNCENATIAAQNSMLKFLEEPGNGITAILTCDNINAILPTIISRCTVLPFLPGDENQLIEQAEALGFDSMDARLASIMVKDSDGLPALWDEKNQKPSDLFNHICLLVKQLLEMDGEQRMYVSADFETTYVSTVRDSGKAKKENLALLSGVYRVILEYCRCALKGFGMYPAWFTHAVSTCRYDAVQLTQLMEIISEQLDACNKYNDLGLVFYQTLARLEEYRI